MSSSFSSGSSDEYDSLLSSASSATSLYGDRTGGGRLPRPLSTVLEEGRGSQGTLWNEEKKDTESAAVAGARQSFRRKRSNTKEFAPSQPNIHTKRACRLCITFSLGCLIALCFGGLHLEKTSMSSRQGNVDPKFDYIVVGGGPAGIIAAVKLARRFPQLSVLLLEAGTVSQSQVLMAQQEQLKAREKHKRDTCSAVAGDGLVNAMTASWNKFDIPLLWSGVASSQPRSVQDTTDTAGDPHLWPLPGVMITGRGLGGGGLINAMIAIRSLTSDWDHWNLTQWDYEQDVVPHFVALERYSGVDDTVNPDATKPWRGTKGPITTLAVASGTECKDAVGQAFVQAAAAAGLPVANQGFNTREPSDRIGAGFYEYNIRYGTRDSVAQALLGRRPLPSNLVLKTGHTVTRVLITPTGSIQAEGVAYQTMDGQVGEYLLSDDSASQVILAAGAILTPQLLQQSGLGPNGSILDLPGVGANLQDHPVVALSYEIAPTSSFHRAISIYTIGNEWENYMTGAAHLANVNATEGLTPEQMANYKMLGVIGTAGFSAGAFLRSPWASDNNSAPDIQITVFPRVMEPHVTRRNQYSDKFMESSAILITVALLQADARYHVKASVPAANPVFSQGNQWVNFEAPTLELPHDRDSYLSHDDILRLEWGVSRVRNIVETLPLKTELGQELDPGRLVNGFPLRQWINNTVLPNAHWVGTTRMGKADDPLAVVDESLLVKGTTNLRIVDAGVIPGAPNGNIHTTVAAVASRGTELIAQARQQDGQTDFT